MLRYVNFFYHLAILILHWILKCYIKLYKIITITERKQIMIGTLVTVAGRITGVKMPDGTFIPSALIVKKALSSLNETTKPPAPLQTGKILDKIS